MAGGKRRSKDIPPPPRGPPRPKQRVEEQDDEPCFTATLDNSKDFTKLLKSLSFAENCLIALGPTGVKISAQHSKSIKGQAYFPAKHFSRFEFRPEDDSVPINDQDVYFLVHLATFLECLNIFGSSSTTQWNALGAMAEQPADHGVARAVRFHYHSRGHPFVLTLEEGTSVTNCKLTTYEPVHDTDLEDQFKVENGAIVSSKVIVLADWLKETFGDIDHTSPTVTMNFNGGDDAKFEILAQGTTGSAKVTVPGNSELLLTFQCEQDCSTTYSHQLLQHIVKALPFAIKTSLRINDQGFLCAQLMIPMDAHLKKDDGAAASTTLFNFVEFFVAPQVDE